MIDLDNCKLFDNDSAKRWHIDADVNLPENTHFINPVLVSSEGEPGFDAFLGFVTIMADSPATGKVPAEFYLRWDCPERLDMELGQKEWFFGYRCVTLKTESLTFQEAVIEKGDNLLVSIAVLDKKP